jgi:hypothetical protein
MIANLANAQRLGSITKEIENVCTRENPVIRSGYKEVKEAQVNAVVASGKLNHQDEYAIQPRDSFETCLELIAKKASGDNPRCLVLDNLETIFDS